MGSEEGTVPSFGLRLLQKFNSVSTSEFCRLICPCQVHSLYAEKTTCLSPSLSLSLSLSLFLCFLSFSPLHSLLCLLSRLLWFCLCLSLCLFLCLQLPVVLYIYRHIYIYISLSLRLWLFASASAYISVPLFFIFVYIAVCLLSFWICLCCFFLVLFTSLSMSSLSLSLSQMAPECRTPGSHISRTQRPWLRHEWTSSCWEPSVSSTTFHAQTIRCLGHENPTGLLLLSALKANYRGLCHIFVMCLFCKGFRRYSTTVVLLRLVAGAGQGGWGLLPQEKRRRMLLRYHCAQTYYRTSWLRITFWPAWQIAAPQEYVPAKRNLYYFWAQC